MCCCSNGEYGVDPGLIYSFPCVTRAGQVEVVQGVDHSEFSQEKLNKTLTELRSERDAVESLALLK